MQGCSAKQSSVMTQPADRNQQGAPTFCLTRTELSIDR